MINPIRLKRFIVHSPFYKPLIELKAVLLKYRISLSKNPDIISTIYVLSPYKTGTTYIGSLWDNDISKHEPFHLYSLRYLNKNFETNFRKRSNVLKLKMECSGFLSLYLNKLPRISEENKLRYIYILRPPSKWVSSVINFFPILVDTYKDYIDSYYWNMLLGYSMFDIFKNREIDGLEKLVNDLYKVYFKLFESALCNPDIEFVELSNVERLITLLERDFSVKSNYDQSRKRETKKIFYDIKVDNFQMEEKYRQLLSQIPKERKIE